MEWKAEIQTINGVKQIMWEFGYQKGVTITDLSTEPEDLVTFVKNLLGGERVTEIEEEGKIEPQMIDMEEMFKEMARNANS